MARRLKIALALLTVVGASHSAMAQTALVRGFVTDAVDGEALVGVNVALHRDGALLTGAATRSDGFFALSGISPGQYTITFSFIGYATRRDSLRLSSGETRLYNAELSVAQEEMGEVVVESDREAGVARARAGQITIVPADVMLIPSPAVGGDLVNYLTTLPGVVTMGDRGGQLFIRGGEPWHNLVLMDGMWVYQPFHVLGFFSSFPAEILSRVDVYAGGYGSRFGGRLSSVIDVDARNGSKRSLSGSITLSPFVSGALVEGPLVKDRLSFLVSLRESVIEQGAGQWVRDPLPYRFGDLFAKLHAKVSDQGQMSISVLRTHDRGTIGEAAIGRDRGGALQVRPPDEVAWKNEAYGFRYVILPKSFPVFAEFLISGSRLTTELGNPDRPDRKGSVASFNTSANVTHFAGALEILDWGVFARTLEMQSELSGQFQEFVLDREWVTEVGLYMEPSFEPSPGLTVRAGLRVHSFPSKARSFVEPRVRAVWSRDRDTWSAALGVYHQEIVGLSDRRDAANVFTVWAAVPYRKVPRATHAILGYSRRVAAGLEIGVEAYHKGLSDLFIPEWTAFPRFTTRLQPADGSVWGGDIRMEARIGRFHGTLTYGLSSVEYHARQETLGLWFGSPQYSFRPGHDRRHQVNLVVGVESDLVDVSAHWQFGSGLPFSRALGFDGFVLLDGPVDAFTEQGSQRVIYERPYNGILPTYHRLDVSVSRTVPVSTGELKLQVGLINAYDRRNLFYLDTFTLTRADQLPIIPTFGVQYVFAE